MGDGWEVWGGGEPKAEFLELLVRGEELEKCGVGADLQVGGELAQVRHADGKDGIAAHGARHGRCEVEEAEIREGVQKLWKYKAGAVVHSLNQEHPEVNHKTAASPAAFD